MGWVDTWLPATKAAVSNISGTGPNGNDGAPLPILSGVDTIGILGMISPSVVSAVGAFEQGQGDLPQMTSRVTASDAGGLSDGVFDSMTEAALGVAAGTTIVKYVAGHGTVPGAYKRSESVGGPTCEPWLIDSIFSEQGLLFEVRQLMDDWQRALDAAASGVMSVSSDTTQAIDNVSLQTFWSGVQRICVSLDVLNENPPVSDYDKIAGATHAALTASANFAGKAAADIAGGIGDAAGAATAGFFNRAGAVALVVAGVAVFLYVR